MITLLPDLSVTTWVVLTLATFIVGITKSALPGAVTIVVAMYAAVLPAKESTGAILVLLILGDFGAILVYRRTVSWATLVRLIPTVIFGLILGYLFLDFSNDTQVSIAIAVILLLIIGVGLYQTRQTRKAHTKTASPSGGAAPSSELKTRTERLFYGTSGGFMTMVANAAGPSMSMYFLTVRLPARMFLGTMAWFFAVINLIKLPFSINLGLVTPESVVMNIVLIPALIGGFMAGLFVIKRVTQETFEHLIIVFTVIGSSYLLYQGFS